MNEPRPLTDRERGAVLVRLRDVVDGDDWELVRRLNATIAAKDAEIKALTREHALLTDTVQELGGVGALPIDGEAARLLERIEELRQKVGAQRERIVYLEGATSHATGTPLTKAKREIEELRERVEAAEGIINASLAVAISQGPHGDHNATEGLIIAMNKLIATYRERFGEQDAGGDRG